MLILINNLLLPCSPYPRSLHFTLLIFSKTIRIAWKKCKIGINYFNKKLKNIRCWDIITCKRGDLINLKLDLDKPDVAKLQNCSTDFNNLKSDVDKLVVDKLQKSSYLKIIDGNGNTGLKFG